MVIGNPESFHVGAHFFKAANEIGLKAVIKDIKGAFSESLLIQSALWKYGGHKPKNLGSFGNEVVAHCKEGCYSTVLATGIAPLDRNCLRHLRSAGIQSINYLTDDPWNRAHHAPWFLNALSLYDNVFTTKSSIIQDLTNAGCRKIHFCPFGYDREVHNYPPHKDSAVEGLDILFVGGMDSDRKKIMEPLIGNNFCLALYGRYWDQSDRFAKSSCGHGDLFTLAKRGKEAKITLCLVRRANRDGHVMRSFEAAAAGGCMLVEDTEEHREIFGLDGDCVVFFNSNEQMVQRARWLLDHPEERLRLRHAVYRRIVTEGKNTYTDRLKTILEKIGLSH